MIGVEENGLRMLGKVGLGLLLQCFLATQVCLFGTSTVRDFILYLKVGGLPRVWVSQVLSLESEH